MKTNEIQKLKKDETWLPAAIIVFLLIIVPCLPLGKYGGGITMVVLAALGMIAYYAAFSNRLRGRGQLKAAIVTTVASFVVSGVVALVYWLWRAHSH